MIGLSTSSSSNSSINGSSEKNFSSTYSSSLCTSNSCPLSCSPIEEINMTYSIREVGSSTIIYVDELGESLGWILDLYTWGIFFLPANNGMHVSKGGVALFFLVALCGDVGVELRLLFTNLSIELCYLYMHPKWF